jgi:hypothetical protein
MAGIFISYRRDDSQGFAGRLAQDLSQVLGDNGVFSDVEIPPGHDFSEVLHSAVAGSDALLVVIGRRWAGDSALGHPSRLFEPADWVRTEIEAAFAQGKPVIPVLVGGTTMPAPDTLPPSLQGLPRLQAMSMSDRHWAADLALLLQHLRAWCPGLVSAQTALAPNPGPAPAPAPTPAPTDGTPAQALNQIAQAVLEQVRQIPARQPRPPAAPGGGLAGRLLGWAARRLRGWATLVVVLGAAYVGLRLFGDAQMLAQLDAFEARLQTAWQRLLQALAQR